MSVSGQLHAQVALSPGKVLEIVAMEPKAKYIFNAAILYILQKFAATDLCRQ
jgi:hypothetical protein